MHRLLAFKTALHGKQLESKYCTNTARSYSEIVLICLSLWRLASNQLSTRTYLWRWCGREGRRWWETGGVGSGHGGGAGLGDLQDRGEVPLALWLGGLATCPRLLLGLKGEGRVFCGV